MEFGLSSEDTIDNPEGDALERDNIFQWYSITPYYLQLLSLFNGDIMDFNIYSEEEGDDEDKEDNEDYHLFIEDK